jgi:hypothetical protein
MGVEYNQLGEVCESRKTSQREEIHMGCHCSFRKSVFGHEQQVENRKESLDLEHPWRKNSRACWSVSREYLELKTEEPSCHA